MNILIACDKFKGSATSAEINDCIAAVLREKKDDLSIRTQAIADGGDGSLQVLESIISAKKINCIVADPIFRPINAYYLLDNQTAYIELAQASGIHLLKTNERNVLMSSTFGTGQLIKDAIRRGATDIFLFLGGSATNDGGIGIMSALGYKFLNKDGMELVPTGKNVSNIFEIDGRNGQFKKNITFNLLCDVTNPLVGPRGASYIYGPQKGATLEDIELLDEGLKHYSSLIADATGIDVSQIPGTGAAGGIAASLVGILNGQIISGVDWLTEKAHLKDQIKWADYVITGEGRFDNQSLDGKVFSGIHQLCSKMRKPILVVCGSSDISEEQQKELKIQLICQLINSASSLEEAIHSWKDVMSKAVLELADYL